MHFWRSGQNDRCWPLKAYCNSGRSSVKPQKDLPRSQCKSAQNSPLSDLTFGQDFLDNKIFAETFDINWLSTLASGQSSFYLTTFKVIFIESFEPFLCRQKEFVCGL